MYRSFLIEQTYAAFTVNAVSAKAGTLPLNVNHGVKLNVRGADGLDSIRSALPDICLAIVLVVSEVKSKSVSWHYTESRHWLLRSLV